MGQLEKLLAKLASRPRTFKYTELKSLLISLGYSEVNQGKTSGSRVAFIHGQTNHIVRLHKPHPGNEIKKYLIDQIYNELKTQGYIE